MKWIIAMAMVVAWVAQGATITSKSGKTVVAEVVSYEDGVFNIRVNGQVSGYSASSIAKIEFDPQPVEDEEPEILLVADDLAPEVRMDIVKIATVLSRSKTSSNCYVLKPSVRIDCREYSTTFGQRPLVLLRLSIQETKSGAIGEVLCWYDWIDDYGWRRVSSQHPCYPVEMSAIQPQCDLKMLSPETLSKGSSDREEEGLEFSQKVEILAARAEIWVCGKLVTFRIKQYDKNAPFPSSWQE